MVRRSAGFVSKKPHRKSRGGCQTCKRKKVKCDECQPVCGYCSARQIKCEFASDALVVRNSPSISSRGSSISPQQSPPSIHDSPGHEIKDIHIQIPVWITPPSQSANGELTALDHYLLQHYQESTWKTFAASDNEDIARVHQIIIPRSSISHKHLLYALLATAAIHSNNVVPSKEVEQQALVYRQKTFQEYSKALRNISSDNYESLIMTATIFLALIQCPKHEDGVDEHLEWLHSLLKMSEGLRFLASLRWARGMEKLSIYPMLRRETRSLPPPPLTNTGHQFTTRIGPVGTTPDQPNPAPTYHQQVPQTRPLFLPPPLMALFMSMMEQDEQGPFDMHRHTLIPVCYALSPLFLSLYYYHLNSDFYTRTLVFSSFIGADFTALVKLREPRALTLICWWFALAILLPRRWWVGEPMEQTCDAVGKLLETNGSPMTQEAFGGVHEIMRIFRETGDREAAARSIFEAWEGVKWDEGPQRAEEWELSQLLDLSALDA